MTLYSSAEIVEHALRLIGQVSVFEQQADSDLMAVSLPFLDMLIAENTAVTYLPFKVSTINNTIALTPSDQTAPLAYNLNALLNDQINYVHGVYLYLNDIFQKELSIVRRYDAEKDGRWDEVSTPAFAYITSGDSPDMIIYPKPNVTGFSVQIKAMAFSPDASASQGKIAHSYPESWQLFLVYSLAALLGSGPIVTLPAQRITMLEIKAKEKHTHLIGSRAGSEQGSFRRNRVRPNY